MGGGRGRLPAFDRVACRDRNTAERCINLLKRDRAVAIRYDTRAAIFEGTVPVASIRIWLLCLTRPKKQFPAVEEVSANTTSEALNSSPALGICIEEAQERGSRSWLCMGGCLTTPMEMVSTPEIEESGSHSSW